ncbi:MAG: glycosyl transferase [Oscillospiraceae bacterium]|nr:glycosyl transferase [Oscillospiraceae bacterium]
MIFVAVGTQKFQLNRLLMKIDELIESGKIKGDNVFAQTGHSDYVPKHYQYKKFLNKNEFDSCISECEILITHSGVGTIIAGMKCKKPIIVFPRLAKFKEHVDDHQLQIADSFSEQNFVLLCNENDDLMELIEKTKVTVFSVYNSQKNNVIDEIRRYLKTF